MAKRLPDLPSLDLLRGFEAAARHLSFTLAAAELYLTQSAVSRQIATLEARLGVRLFVRRNRGLTLTDDGETLRAAVAKAFREVDDALERIRSPVTRTLNVTASVAFSALWLVPRLPRFAREHPGVDVRLSATSALLDLARDRIDVAVRYCAPHAAPADAVELFGGDVVPVCSPKLLRDRARPRSAALRRPAAADAVAGVVNLARGGRHTRPQARGFAAFQSSRPCGTGRSRGAGTCAWNPLGAGRPAGRQASGRAVCAGLARGPRLLRDHRPGRA
jgi:DNA-binding transcriptional LysR family regulator